MDTACFTKLTPIPLAATTAYQIVRLEPYTSLFTPPHAPTAAGASDGTSGAGGAAGGSSGAAGAAGVSIVHHMDVFVCDDRMREPSDEECITDSWLGDNG